MFVMKVRIDHHKLTMRKMLDGGKPLGILAIFGTKYGQVL
jgi:hypothetical protein